MKLPVLFALAAVAGGEETTGYPEVVAISGAAGVYCTGLVLEDSRVLTAAHCVRELPTSVEIAELSIEVASATVHPDYEEGEWRLDLALITLAEPAPAGAAFARLATQTPAAGAEVTVVGFGVTAIGAGDQGVKRWGRARIESTGALDFELERAPAQPCAGDSGGPVFDAEGAVVGIVFGGDLDCSHRAYAARIEHVESFAFPSHGCSAGGAGASQTAIWVILAMVSFLRLRSSKKPPRYLSLVKTKERHVSNCNRARARERLRKRRRCARSAEQRQRP